MTTTTIKQLNEHTLLVKPEFHMISGRKQLKREDLNLADGVELPPETLASLGSKKFINPDEINKFKRLYTQAKNKCGKAGVSFMGGYAIPKDKVDGVMNELDDLVIQFEQNKTDFVSNYERLIDSWCSDNPEWEDIVRRAVTPKHQVAAALSADYSIYQVSNPDGIGEERMNRKTVGLSDKLFDEIIQETNTFIEQSLKIEVSKNVKRFRTNEEGVTQKALRPIRTMRDKLKGLSFLNGKEINPVISHIDHILGLMPDKGRIQNNDFNTLVTLAIAMGSKENIKQLGSALASSADLVDDFSDSTGNEILIQSDVTEDEDIVNDIELAEDDVDEAFSFDVVKEVDEVESSDEAELIAVDTEEVINDADGFDSVDEVESSDEAELIAVDTEESSIESDNELEALLAHDVDDEDNFDSDKNEDFSSVLEVEDSDFSHLTGQDFDFGTSDFF